MTCEIKLETGRLRRTGTALVLTLSVLVLVSAMVVGFLSQAARNRQLAFSSRGQAQAQILGKAALEVVIADLIMEMRAGSDIHTLPAGDVLVPKKPRTVRPLSTTPAALVNLVRLSRAGEPLWLGDDYSTPGPERSVTPVPTTSPSLNGRFLRPSRWAKPQLLAQSTLSEFIPPDWLILTRSGPLSAPEPALSVLSDSAESNPLFAVGRFAYAIYDTGGLLDINVAGNPSDPATNSRRGRLHHADLSRIPGILQPEKLVAWRNPATLNKIDWFFDPLNSFLKVYDGDQRFVSRQDLLRYSLDHPDVLASESLLYLTTFSRERNQPSFAPETPTQENPHLAKFQRSDGKPLFRTRFPLSKLKLVLASATADSGSEIYRYFGLTRSDANAPWIYNQGAPEIATLDIVAARSGRPDPDMLEVLKAAILSGSLAKTAGDPANPTSDTAFRTADLDAKLDRQVARIAACIIDQYDKDSWPTRIVINGDEVCGVENLPFLNRIFDSPYRPNGGPMIESWWAAEVWNPHQNAASANTDGPTRFRFTAVSGQAYVSLTDTAGTVTVKGNITTFTPASTWVQFETNSSQRFLEPTLLTTANCTSDHPALDASGITGLYVGSVAHGSIPESKFGAAGAIPFFPVRLELQYQGADGQYHCYQALRSLRLPNRTAPLNAYKTLNPNRAFYFWSDPRNTRFGAGNNSLRPAGLPMRDDAGVVDAPYGTSFDGRYTTNGPVSENPGWKLLRTMAPTHARLSALANNDPASSTNYASPDGLLRLADGGLRGPAQNPFQSGNVAARPIVLNRAFTSVGELGYAFRDEPWKTLDFFTQNSADAGLLDAFSLDEAELIAGKVNLNTRQPKVLEALLKGALRQEAGATSNTISDTTAAVIAQDLVNMSRTEPLLNKSDLVTRFSTLNVDGNYPAIKTEREAAIRALGEAGQTRTWNLLLDLVAQAGRYPAHATSHTGFVVEGERRYWLHVAIDRFTGQVVARQVEAVYE